ncbi:MAG: tRNA (guanosine(37)-N1)-methyltransferase TrmD [Candidatus Nanopelagicales bacterium]
MKIDIVSIFPEYFDAINLSILGKAITDGILDVSVHDLRDATKDKHRSVDDSPYGGGPGMVMMAEPWGKTLDAIIRPDSVLVVPTPSGQLLTQSMLQDLSSSTHLVFACGRYEGIDQRVFDYYRSHCSVIEVSLGNYVVAGGEVAALVMLEGVSRLLSGVVGNPDSIMEDSFGQDLEGLLEWPVYTKPQEWRGLSVPEVLLSGNHAEISKWRRQQSEAKTRESRPDLG